jgi:hypothetical protein
MSRFVASRNMYLETLHPARPGKRYDSIEIQEFHPIVCIRAVPLYQSAVPSNWFELAGVIPLDASSLPNALSTLILPDMKG